MAEVLVLAEHSGGEVRKVTGELLTVAARLGTPVAVWAGDGAQAGRARLAELGARKVYVAGGSDFAEFVVAPKAELLAQLVAASGAAAVLVAGSAEGREVAGRLAVMTGAGVLADAVDVAAGEDGAAVVSQANFGGAVTVRSAARGALAVIVVRPNAVAAEPVPGEAAELVPVDFTASGQARAARVVAREPAARSARPDLAEAQIVVSGGRGTGSADGFRVIEDLADALGAAVGASRAVV
ncbi:MAG TPA: electron transfer flavoprotein subunit alpha/FixB family protein, partial [Trebonia sp.]|nr:electron transfer flavoprotein subunit alpha/FixB family protein [Trebonia sp.]